MRFRKNEYSALDAAIEAAQRFWAGILCNIRVNFANTCWGLSDGSFDISSGVLHRAWSSNSGDQIPAQSEIDLLLPLVGWDKIQWDGENISLPANMEIDLGGLGKEFAVDHIATLVNAINDVSVLINYGG